MTQGRVTGWIWAAAGIAAVGIGGGWLAAWEADKAAIAHWQILAEEEAADVTESVAVTLEQAEQHLLAFARSLPDGARARTARFDAIFQAEAATLNMTDGRIPFEGLVYATWIPPAGRPQFEAQIGVEIQSEDRKAATSDGEALVVLNGHGPSERLFFGLDLLSDPVLAETASNGFRAGGTVVTGPSFDAGGRRLSPIAVRQGDNGLVLGLLDLEDVLDTTLAVGMPDGLCVTVEERASAGKSTAYAPIFSRGTPQGDSMTWETRYAQGGVGWRLMWTADERFRGGPSTELGDALRLGSIAGSVLIAAVLAFASAARRREDALDRQRGLMQATVERMSEGIAVVDKDLNFVACNDYFRRMYDLPESRFPLDRPIEEIVRFRAERGDIGPVPDIARHVRERLEVFRNAGAEILEEALTDGRTIEIRRSRTPDGMLVSLYLDVTERKRAEAERAATAALIATTFDHMSDALTAVDAHGALLHWNARFVELFGLEAGLVHAGTHLRRAFDGGLSDRDARTMAAVLDRMNWSEAGVESEIAPPELVGLDGECWLQISHRAIPDQGFVITYTDVSERMQISEALRRSEERYALAAEGANDGLWDWDLGADRLYTSPRWREMVGIGRDPISDRVEEWFDRVHPKDIEELHQDISDHLDGRTDHLQAEFRLLHADGAYIWTLARGVASRDADGRPVRLTGSLTDVTKRKRAEEKLIRDALYDMVTGLPNRALFLDRIEQERRRHSDLSEDTFAVLFLDLDRFKVVNDSLGHDLGDALLIEVARRLEQSVKPGDSVARLAGDEFGVLLTGIADRGEAQDAVHWLQADLAAAFSVGDQEVFTSVCVGISLPSQGFSDAEEMLRAADIAMYKAKERGQSSTAVFDPQMQSRAISQMQLENDLRRAVDRGEIEMYYQPIISFRTGRIAGVEALARWRHPDRGTVVPADFIPLAEDTGLINTIGTAALRLACRQMKQWERDLGAHAPETMSVNLSSRQLQDPDMVREIELILAREGVDGAQLKLEVTESMIMMNPELTSRILMELKQLGVALSIDDFGTGYSSLSYLHRFPFDTLKIDRSFVVSMEEKTENMEIIRSIALLAHNLGMDIIAEGVETERHLRRLNDFNCEFGQGYYFSTPLPAAKIAELIRANHTWDIAGTGQQASVS